VNGLFCTNYVGRVKCGNLISHGKQNGVFPYVAMLLSKLNLLVTVYMFLWVPWNLIMCDLLQTLMNAERWWEYVRMDGVSTRRDLSPASVREGTSCLQTTSVLVRWLYIM
jgi:hypothetical protein